MQRPRARAVVFVSSLMLPLWLLWRGSAAAAPSLHEREVQVPCGPPPPDGARWFFASDPGTHPAGEPARRALTAIVSGFSAILTRDPRCLRIEVLDEQGLSQQYRKLSRSGPRFRIGGFHSRRLGVDTNVYVTPIRGVKLEFIIVHEMLHALSHRFTKEAGLSAIVEGATEYLARDLAVSWLGLPRKTLHSGYDKLVDFYAALMKRLGDEGPDLLARTYLSGGYYAFEREVDQRLDVSLRDAGRALETGDLATAIQRISARAGRGGAAPPETSTGGL